MNTFQYMTYEQWLKANPEVEMEEEDCPDCDGTGEVTCHCCGHEHDCDKCDGIGVVKGAKQMYLEQLAKDKEAVARFSKAFASKAIDQNTKQLIQE